MTTKTKQAWEKADELIAEVLKVANTLNTERAAVHKRNGMNFRGIRAEALTGFLHELLDYSGEDKTIAQIMRNSPDAIFYFEKAELEQAVFEKVAHLGFELRKACVRLKDTLGINLLEHSIILVPPDPRDTASTPDLSPAIANLKKNSEIMAKWAEIDKSGVNLWYCVGKKCGIVWDRKPTEDQCPNCGSEDIFQVTKLVCDDCGREPYEGDEPLVGDECEERNNGQKCYGKFVPRAPLKITWREEEK